MHSDIRLSDAQFMLKMPKTFKQKIRHSLFVLRILVIIFLIIALTRPQTKSSAKDITIEGIDIVLAMDISGSMLAEDFRPNRLEASKDVAMDFIEGRPNDRIGLVLFGSASYTQCPLTSDHAKLMTLFDAVKSGDLSGATAIGDGLATAVNRLRESKAIGKVIILLTDGINNAGAIDPLTAAEIAKLYNIRVYTIGVGTIGKAPYPFNTPFGIQYQNIDVKIDEALLKEIAETDNGKYFRATNKKKLEEIYKEIDQLEKSKMEVLEYNHRTDIYFPFALIAIILLTIEIVARYLYFKNIP